MQVVSPLPTYRSLAPAHCITCSPFIGRWNRRWGELVDDSETGESPSWCGCGAGGRFGTKGRRRGSTAPASWFWRAASGASATSSWTRRWWRSSSRPAPPPTRRSCPSTASASSRGRLPCPPPPPAAPAPVLPSGGQAGWRGKAADRCSCHGTIETNLLGLYVKFTPA